MKKYRIVALALALLLFTACGGNAEETASAAETEQSVQPASAALQPGENEASTAEETTAAKEIQINYITGCYTYDVDDPEQAAYYHDNIFAAVVVEVGEQFDPYWEPDYVEEYSAPSFYFPCYTRYQLQVTQVIKGNLQVGDVISARKLGYIDEENGEYNMVENTVMPEEGIEYLFLANNHMNPDEYAISDPYTTIPLESSDTEISTYALTEEEPDRQAIIDQYVEAYENERPCPDELGQAFAQQYLDDERINCTDARYLEGELTIMLESQGIGYCTLEDVQAIQYVYETVYASGAEYGIEDVEIIVYDAAGEQIYDCRENDLRTMAANGPRALEEIPETEHVISRVQAITADNCRAEIHTLEVAYNDALAGNCLTMVLTEEAEGAVTLDDLEGLCTALEDCGLIVQCAVMLQNTNGDDLIYTGGVYDREICYGIHFTWINPALRDSVYNGPAPEDPA